MQLATGFVSPSMKRTLLDNLNRIGAASSKSSPTTETIKVPAKDPKLTWDLGKFAFSLLPLSPEAVGRRKTIFTEVVKDTIWTLDQVQGIININVPVRSTVIRLKSGGLFVNNPVASTREALEFIKGLEKVHGPVKYITLASLALEHKGTSGSFCSYFPSATVYIQPGQYSFPVNLPTALYYRIGTVLKEIPASSKDAPWGDEIDHQVLGPLRPPGRSHTPQHTLSIRPRPSSPLLSPNII